MLNFSVKVDSQFFLLTTASAVQSVRFKNGGSLDLARIKKQLIKEEIYRIYNPEGDFLGLGQAVNEELIIKRIYTEK